MGISREQRRERYLAKIKEAEDQAAKARNEETARRLRKFAEGYRTLVKRLERQMKGRSSLGDQPVSLPWDAPE